MTRVLLTGAGGFIACEYSSLFTQFTIGVCDTVPKYSTDPNVEFDLYPTFIIEYIYIRQSMNTWFILRPMQRLPAIFGRGQEIVLSASGSFSWGYMYM